ncbi:MAG: Biotin carboxyl carrier protein of methylcrotonyl-CoA carboxylase, partial [uncultured Solirubrobacteraceae bacterium]
GRSRSPHHRHCLEDRSQRRRRGGGGRHRGHPRVHEDGDARRGRGRGHRQGDPRRRGTGGLGGRRPDGPRV